LGWECEKGVKMTVRRKGNKKWCDNFHIGKNDRLPEGVRILKNYVNYGYQKLVKKQGLKFVKTNFSHKLPRGLNK